MSFGIPVRNGLGIGLKASTSLSTRGGASGPPLPPSISTIFATSLYTGTGAAQTITNGIDLAGSGGLVWLKRRSTSQSHALFDTNRGENPYLCTDLTDSQFNFSNGVVYNSNGFTNKANSFFGGSGDGLGSTYVAWTFRQAPNFFDVVTFTSNSSGGASFSHNLGSTPGMVIIKCTGATESWWVWHRSLATDQYMRLNLTNAVSTQIPTITCTSTTVTLSSGWLLNNNTNYVAYLFAHDTASTGIIQCGSYTGNGSATGPVINLGWQPQWLMIKNASGTGNWQMIDSVRGMSAVGSDATLQANLANGETSANYVSPSATGFQIVSTNSDVNTNSNAYIYIAIRSAP
jgi:hypothetical protein